MSIWGQLNLQDAASPVIKQLTSLHDHAILIVLLVITFVFYILTTLVRNNFTYLTAKRAHTLEAVWTILPAAILICLAVPSLRLLYFIDEVADPRVTLKAIGHQWYWAYEYSDSKILSFDSYIIPTEDLKPGIFRLLEVDHRAVLPTNIEIRLISTSRDVIHSWTVPSLGVKIDAIPGRINQTSLTLNRPGVFYGQCSEICGSRHSFIPIAIEAVTPPTFISWLKNARDLYTQ